jgi:hypothetical protein
VLCLVILPWVFARWLGSGPVTMRGVMLGGLLMVAGFGLSAWCVRSLIALGGGTQSREPLQRQAERYEEKVVAT